MSYKRLGSMAVLFVLLGFPASASMISIMLVETGIDERFSSGYYASLWEDGLMAAFFDAGHIVTNSPVTRMLEKPDPTVSGPFEDAFREAISNGANYYILGFLEYGLKSGKTLPVSIALKVFDSDSGQVIHTQTFPAGIGSTEYEEFLLAQNAGQSLISQIKDR